MQHVHMHCTQRVAERLLVRVRMRQAAVQVQAATFPLATQHMGEEREFLQIEFIRMQMRTGGGDP